MTWGRLPRAASSSRPFADVMLVLVVILIVTAPLLASAIRLDLPSSGAAQPAGAAVSVLVTLDPGGSLFLNDRPVTPAELAQRLAATARVNPETEVHLRADRSVPYGRVVEVMGAAQQAGLNRIGFIADPKAP
jgi:biopolymer transport protein TolR